jgi:hypothetical protein
MLRGTRRVRALCVAFVFIAAAPVAAAERFAVIVSGAAGGEKYAAQQQQWREELASSLKQTFSFPESNVVVLDERGKGSLQATAANVRSLFDDLRRRVAADDTLMVVFIGHGTFDGVDAKFNLVGPDLTAREWKAMFAGVRGRLVVVNTTESSFPFLEELSQRGRVVITATDSAAQRFATVFPQYFVQAFQDLSNDFDKNGRVSVWEAFTTASTLVRQHYEQRGQLSTERPLLDDDGDKVGREFESPGEDGTLAKTIYLNTPPETFGADPETAALEGQRRALEAQIEELKTRKASGSLSDEQYAGELEKLLVQLARITQQLRKKS